MSDFGKFYKIYLDDVNSFTYVCEYDKASDDRYLMSAKKYRELTEDEIREVKENGRNGDGYFDDYFFLEEGELYYYYNISADIRFLYIFDPYGYKSILSNHCCYDMDSDILYFRGSMIRDFEDNIFSKTSRKATTEERYKMFDALVKNRYIYHISDNVYKVNDKWLLKFVKDVLSRKKLDIDIKYIDGDYFVYVKNKEKMI